ncbi:MAG TPA: serine/threonine-protein kinase [Kofleriaceae bacterium]
MQNSPARSAIDVGSVIADTYTIEALIGRGGMGAVFLATHKRLPGKQVAIKVLHAEMSGDEVLARFKREAEIASRLGHPNIVQVHDFNVMPDGTPYLVLEYLQGESLAQRLQRGPLPLDHALSIVRQVGSALAAAHREGIVHRDLKPQNIFLVPTEVHGSVVEIAKVLDFGISKIRGSTTVKTQDSALLGTPQYMAPEQALGQHKNVDERTDGFAFGTIVYEMLSGQPAFTGETIPEVVFKVVYEQPVPLAQHVALPETVTTAVHRAMAKNAAERFATISDLVEALTGQPLAPARSGVSIPPPGGGPPTGSRTPSSGSSRAPNTGNDAFAQTMGSGDHGPAVAQGVADPAVAKPADRALGSAPTIDSQNLGNAGTVSSHPPPARRRTGLIVACIVAGVALAAGGVWFAMRGDDEPKQVAVVAAHDAAVAPPVEVAVDAAVEPVDKVPEIEVAKPPEVKKAQDPKPKDPVKKVPPPPRDADDDGPDDGDEVLGKKLADAQAALAAGKWDRAETLANSVSTSEDATARQRARAIMIFGMVQCKGRNDTGRALAAARKLTAAPKLRRRLLDACKLRSAD